MYSLNKSNSCNNYVSVQCNVSDFASDLEENVDDPSSEELSSQTQMKSSKSKGFSCGICRYHFFSKSILMKHYLTHKNAQFKSFDDSPTNESSSVNKHNLSSKTSFTCEICQREFQSKTQLSIHTQSHSKEEIFCCNICSKQFYRKASLVIHQISHNLKKSFYCKSCNKSFISETLLEMHQQTHSARKILLCEICGEKFFEKRLLKEHYNEHDVKRFECKHCGETYDNILDFENHISIHFIESSDSEQDFSSDKCSKNFTSKELLEDHENVHSENSKLVSRLDYENVLDLNSHTSIKSEVIETNDSMQNFSCEKCSEKFTSKKELEDHQTIHSESPKLRTCDECGKCFTTFDGLKRHLRLHNSVITFYCDTCEKTFKSERGLNDHCALHTNPNSFACQFCKKKFKNSGKLSYHNRTCNDDKSNESKTPTCNVCFKTFRIPSDLKIHMVSHEDVKPYACTQCDKRFKRVMHLNRHIFRHTKIKQYVCNICHKEYAQKITLVEHLRLHTGEKPFMCDVCGKRFHSKQVFRVHKARHDANKMVCEKPPKFTEEHLTVMGPNQCSTYICDTCGKEFFAEVTYQNHLFKHSVKSVFKCDKCDLEFVESRRLKLHINRMHVNRVIKEKNFKCESCGKKFWNVTHLRRHSYTHTGEKWFECELCHRKFVTKNNLMFHLKKKICSRDPKEEKKSK